MKQSEAKQKIETFFRRLGNEDYFFNEKNFVQARIGEAFVGFEYDEREEILLVQALIYRFRSEPQDKVLDAIFAEENETNNGGGRIVFDSETLSFYLQKDFTEKIGDEQFYKQINNLAQASLRWSGEILARAAEKANG
jgi:hypothetical protein